MKKKHMDYFLFISVILISIFGIIMIYSASSIWAEFKYQDAFKYVKQQGLFFIIGILAMLFASKIDLEFLRKKANLILGICFILLVLVLIPGIGTVRNGSRSWFGIGGLGVQPSEFAKLGLIIFASKYLARNQKSMGDIKKGALPIFLIIGIFFVLIMLEPDFGTAMVMALTLIALIFASGLKISFFVKLGVLGLAGIVALIIAAPYRMARIVSFLNPWSDPLGSGYQIIQSLYAIGPGGLLGQGFLNSRQKHFYLPEPQTDFIFAVFASNFGLLGAIILIGIIIFFDTRLISMATKKIASRDKFVISGIIGMLVFQQVQNIGMTVGLLPITGITLPFISYGGSSLLSYLILVGIILNISNEKEREYNI